MNIPVDANVLVHNIEDFGTSSDGWEKVAENVGMPEEKCKEIFIDLKKEADRKDRILKKKIMGTGGGPPPPDSDQDPLLEKVKVLVGPSIDGMFTIYDGDSSLMASQQGAKPIEVENMKKDSQSDNQFEEITTDGYFINDRSNLKKKQHHLLTRKRKLETEVPQKQTVSTKFMSLATEKIELVSMQKELLSSQIEDQMERLEHNRLLRAMELEDANKKYKHNQLMRELELKKFYVTHK